MTTDYRGIRKEAKARWVYECPTCADVSIASPDLFRAVEAKQAHKLTSAHVFKAMADAFRPVMDAYIEFGKAVMGAVQPLMDVAKALSDPPNRPHDPTLWADKRKWGAR